MGKIIVLGSLNMDLTMDTERIPEKGETLHGHNFIMTEGGKGGNQAVAAVKCDAEVIFLGAVGDDLFGRQLNDVLTGYGINTEYLQIREEATGVAMIIRCDSDNRILLNAGANFNVDKHSVMTVLDKIGCPGDILICQFENLEDTVFSVMEKAKSIGMITLLNPAPAKQIELDQYRMIDLIIVNQSECELLTDIYPHTKEDCCNPIQTFMERGVSGVIITLGELGSVTQLKEERIEMDAFHVKSIDTTAAGDSFIGTFAAGMAQDKDIHDSLLLATAAAAITVTRLGAQTAIPKKDDILSFLLEHGF